MTPVDVPVKDLETERSRVLKRFDWIVALVYSVGVSAALLYAHFARSRSLIVVILIITPLIGLALVTLLRGRILGNYLFLCTALGPIFFLEDYGDAPLLNNKNLNLWIAAITVALTLLSGFLLFWVNAYRKSPLNLSERLITMFLCMPLWFMYAFGISLAINVQFDDSPGVVYRTQVMSKAKIDDRRPQYALTLPPWGPVTTERELSVSEFMWNNTEPGSEVCVTLWPGALRAPIFEVRFCP